MDITENRDDSADKDNIQMILKITLSNPWNCNGCPAFYDTISCNMEYFGCGEQARTLDDVNKRVYPRPAKCVNENGQ